MAAPSPSTLTYRDRLRLSRDSPFDYNTMYSASASTDVWARLTQDAAFRTQTSKSGSQYTEGSNAMYSAGNLSGFVSNTSFPPKAGVPIKTGFITEGEPIGTLHPITARRFKKKHPIPFYAAIRPETETTNQTLRMLGTYPTDQAYADHFEVFIPSGCPGGKGHYHPDIKQMTHRPDFTAKSGRAARPVT